MSRCPIPNCRCFISSAQNFERANTFSEIPQGFSNPPYRTVNLESSCMAKVEINGRRLDATFSVTQGDAPNRFVITIDSASGASPNRNRLPRNPDYRESFEEVLARLGATSRRPVRLFRTSGCGRSSGRPTQVSRAARAAPKRATSLRVLGRGWRGRICTFPRCCIPGSHPGTPPFNFLFGHHRKYSRTFPPVAVLPFL
jgi:hypothetical protein